MNLRETTLEDLNKISGKIASPNNREDYQYCIKAYALRLNQNYNESISLYQKALEINKNNLEALKGISLCYKKTGNSNLAIKYYTQIKFAQPFDKTVHYELGVLEYERENYMASIKHFINAIKISPDYYDAIYALGQSHEAIDELEMAEMIYLKIIENRPSYLMAYNRLANLYIKLNEYAKAIKYFREIISINPEFHRAYIGIAIAFDKNEQKYEARKYYKKYLEMKPFSAEKDFILGRLNVMRLAKNVQNKNRSHLTLVK